MSGFKISRLQSANSFTCAPVILRDALFSSCRCSVDFNTDWYTGTSLYGSPACWTALNSLILSLSASRVKTFLWTQSWMSSASSELARPPEPGGLGGEERRRRREGSGRVN